MAIIKHQSSCNMNYTDAFDYLRYQHKEDLATGHYEPVLDECGMRKPRENCAITCLSPAGTEVAPETWWASCMKTNWQFHKNQSRTDRKQHQYIISHPEEDRQLMTMDDLLEEGKAFVLANLKGYDALIAVHRDTDNDHIHIVINSVRAAERAPEPWMEKNEDGSIRLSAYLAGGKHQDSPALRRHLNDWLMEYTRSHGLTVKDNNRLAEEHKQARYNQKNEDLKRIFLNTAQRCVTLNEIKSELESKYHIQLVIRGSTISLLAPGKRKAVRLKTLGIDPEKMFQFHPLYQKNRVRQQLSAMKKSDQTEQRSYLEWICYRRSKNNAKAETLLAQSDKAIQEQLCRVHLPFRSDKLQELRHLVVRTIYLEQDLQTELDKIDRILEQWNRYRNPETPGADRRSYGSFLRWCGCDPDSETGYQEIQTAYRVADLQRREVTSIRDAILENSASWWDHNDLSFESKDLLCQEDRLTTELSKIKANREKFGQIAYHYQQVANHRIYKDEYLEKARKFRNLWHDALMEERRTKAQLKALQQNKHPSKNRPYSR